MHAFQSPVEIDTYIYVHNYPIQIEIHRLILVEHSMENTEAHFSPLTKINEFEISKKNNNSITFRSSLVNDGFRSGACGTSEFRVFFGDGKGFNGNPEQSFISISFAMLNLITPLTYALKTKQYEYPRLIDLTH